MTELLTTAGLCDLKLIAESEVEAAIEACMTDPPTAFYVFKEGYRLNLGRAVRNHPGAQDFVSRNDCGPALKRHFLRQAILQAKPARE